MQGDNEGLCKREERFTNKKNKRGWQKLKKITRNPGTEVEADATFVCDDHGGSSSPPRQATVGDFIHAGHPKLLLTRPSYFSLYSSAHSAYTSTCHTLYTVLHA